MYYDNDCDPESPDPCETCGGNFDGNDCATLCDGCDGCQLTGAACHPCNCPQPDAGADEYCHRCRELLIKCECPDGGLHLAQLLAFAPDIALRQLGLKI